MWSQPRRYIRQLQPKFQIDRCARWVHISRASAPCDMVLLSKVSTSLRFYSAPMIWVCVCVTRSLSGQQDVSKKYFRNKRAFHSEAAIWTSLLWEEWTSLNAATHLLWKCWFKINLVNQTGWLKWKCLKAWVHCCLHQYPIEGDHRRWILNHDPCAEIQIGSFDDGDHSKASLPQ